MKIFCTLQIISIMLLIFAQCRDCSERHSFSNFDKWGGYEYKIPTAIRRGTYIMFSVSGILSLIGFLALIWF